MHISYDSAQYHLNSRAEEHERATLTSLPSSISEVYLCISGSLLHIVFELFDFFVLKCQHLGHHIDECSDWIFSYIQLHEARKDMAIVGVRNILSKSDQVSSGFLDLFSCHCVLYQGLTEYR